MAAVGERAQGNEARRENAKRAKRKSAAAVARDLRADGSPLAPLAPAAPRKRSEPARRSWIETVAAAKTSKQRAAVSQRARQDTPRDDEPTLAQIGHRAEIKRAQQRAEPVARRQERYDRYLESPRGQSAAVARAESAAVARRELAQARRFRETAIPIPGVTLNRPRDPFSLSLQAAAQDRTDRSNRKLEEDPAWLGLELAMRARGHQPNATRDTPLSTDSLTKATKDLRAAGVPDDAIREGLSNLPKKEESFALMALQQLARVSSAVAGGVRAGYRGENIPAGVVRGAIKNDQSFSQVLADAGAPEWVQLAGGLTLDIALDPSTYLTLGAKVPATVAAKTAELAAMKAGAHADEALNVAKAVYDAHPLKGRGVQAGFRGTPVRLATAAKGAAKAGSLKTGWRNSVREVSTSGRGTSKLVGTPARAAVQGARELPGASRVTATTDRRDELINSGKPAGMHPLDQEHIRTAARKYRAARGRGERFAAKRVIAYKKMATDLGIGPKGLHSVAVALDAGDLSKLRLAERALADVLRRDLASVARREVEAGVRSAETAAETQQRTAAAVSRAHSSERDYRNAQSALSALVAERAALERSIRAQTGRAGVAQGKAEILAGQSARRQKQPIARGDSVKPVRTLSKLERERGKLHELEIAEKKARLRSAIKAAERTVETLRRDARAASRDVVNELHKPTGLVENYYPRVLRSLADGSGRGAGSLGERVTGASFKARKDRRALADMTPEEVGRYLTDDLTPIARRLGDHGRAMALAVLHDDMAALGPVVRSVDEIDDVGGTLKTVYVRDGRGYKRLWRDGEGYDATRAKVAAAVAAGKEVRAIPEATHETVFAQAQRGRQSVDGPDAHLEQSFDKWQGRLKTLQTIPNPGYHITNLIGDLFNARVGGAEFSQIKGAVRQLRLTRKLDAFDSDVAKSIDDLTAEKLTRGGKTERYGSNGLMPDAEVVDLAREHGAIQTGFAGSELHALQQTESAAPYRLDQRFLEGARAANELREDLVRLVSFRSALKRGMTPKEAAAHVVKHHIDYADLTPVERRFLRRVIPFYTFARHNLPIQARGLVGSPGRYATVEKTRDTTADASGLDEDFASGLASYIQRQVPFAVPGLTAGGLPVAANLKLPLSDLNELDPRTWPDEFAQRMTVLAKMPAELWAKYDFFFKDEIRKDYVPAPSWATDPRIKSIVESLPGGGKVKMIYDRRAGQPPIRAGRAQANGRAHTRRALGRQGRGDRPRDR